MTEPDSSVGPAVAGPDRGSRSGRRQRALPLVAVLLGAGLAAIAAAPTWYTQGYGAGLTASLRRTGAQASPGLLPLALVGVAGIAAVLAARGPLRRLVGLILLAIGALVAVQGISGLAAPPTTAAGDNGPPVASSLLGPVVTHPFGPALAAAGGVLLAAGGLAVLAGLGARRLGRRFEAGAVRTSGLADEVADADDASQWWKAMDTGLDPTGTGGTADPENPVAAPFDGTSDPATPMADPSGGGPTPGHRPVTGPVAERSDNASSAVPTSADAVQKTHSGRLP